MPLNGTPDVTVITLSFIVTLHLSEYPSAVSTSKPLEPFFKTTFSFIVS